MNKVSRAKLIGKISGIVALVATFLLLNSIFNISDKIPVGDSAPVVNNFQPKPTKISIPSLEVDAPIIDLGLNEDKTLEVPEKSSDVGWFVHSPSPGGVGPSIMVGHLDSILGKAVFYDLEKIKPGDEIIVERADGSKVTFKVDSMETYAQDNFPTQKVYGKINHAGLRLITCAGSYSQWKGRYSDNLVVYASLVKIEKN